VGDVMVLLEMPAEWDGDERPPVRDELHRRRQSALDDRKVAAGERAEQVVHVADDPYALDRLERRRIDARAADEQQLCVGDVVAQFHERIGDQPQER
jgi:hypothetical protein